MPQIPLPDENPQTNQSPDASVGARRTTPKLSPGIVLCANTILEDPNFNNTIVLLCQHSADGAYGLVLNRPSHMPLREIFETPPTAPDGRSLTRRVYIGGPVQPTELQILQLGEPVAPDTMEIAPGVHMGGKWETLDEILAPDPEALRLFLGYAGWGEGQLEQEVEAGAWDILHGDIRKLLAAPEGDWFAGGEPLRRFLSI